MYSSFTGIGYGVINRIRCQLTQTSGNVMDFSTVMNYY